MAVNTAILLAEPCDDCGDTGGHLNTGNVRPARLAAERFGFPLGSRVCRSCYEKWRYRLRVGWPRQRASRWRAARPTRERSDAVMAICPATFQGCVDDLCYGGGCLKLPGEPMLETCPGGCGQLVAIDGSDNEACECEPDYDQDDYFDDDED